MQIISVLISFLASVVGSICGIGGGVIIKPVMDAATDYSAATVSFLTSVTVLCMTAYSIGKVMISHSSQVRIRVATILGIGAAAGGVTGKALFEVIKRTAGDGNLLAALQSSVLFVVTLGTLLYTINKKRIRTKNIQNKAMILLIGILLGMMSSFLGIGGGPINLVVFYYLFSLETKEAAQNSLYVILLSQIASILYTACRHAIPQNLPLVLLLCMGVSGVTGGIVGRIINKYISSLVVDKLFIGLQTVITGLCLYNVFSNLLG